MISKFSEECNVVKRKFTRADNYVHCANCGRLIYRIPARRKQWTRFFCKRNCHTQWRRKPKTVYRFVYKPQRGWLVSTEIAQALKTGTYPEYK